MASLELSNACWRASVHSKGVDGLSSDRNGSIISVILNAYATWFTRPNHDRTSVREVGVGKSAIAFVYFLHGRTVSLDISKPANSTVSLANLNLLGFSVMPCLPQRSSHSWACRKLSAMVDDHRRVSSIHFVFLGTCETISS